MVVGEHSFYFAVGLKEGDVLIECIQNLHKVLIIAFFILFVAFLKGDHNKVVVFELFDNLNLKLDTFFCPSTGCTFTSFPLRY